MNDEEVKREFEKWKKKATTAYDQEKHDEFLKQRYYKMHNKQDFNTSSHFSHPGAEAGPKTGPSQSPSDFKNGKNGPTYSPDGPKVIKIKIPGMGGFDRSEHFKSEAQAEEDAGEMRRIAIIFFSVAGSYLFFTWAR